jgi:trigger factor
LRIVEQRFGRQVRQEVIEDVVQSSLGEAMQKEGLRSVGTPRIESIETKPGEGCAYKAAFEVYPEVQLAPFDGLHVSIPVCEIAEADVDRVIENFRKQRQRWEAVDRPSVKGDRLNIDFLGTVEGQPFEGGEAHGFQIELGSGRLIAGFEDGLLGAKGADELDLDIAFPPDYPSAELAGKPARFHVKVNEVCQPVLPEVNEEFFREFGVQEGGAEVFRQEVRTHMERELDQAVKNKVKGEVLDVLYAANTFDLPRVLIDQEANNLCRDARQRLYGMRKIEKQSDLLEPRMFEETAKKRVALGLIASEVVRVAGIKTDPAKVRRAVEGIASSYEDPSGIVSWYYAERGRLADIETMVLENDVVDWVLARIQVSESPCAFDALMNPGQTESQVNS